jgi:hypothetical protein
VIGPLIHVIGVASHAGVPARANWYPWTDDNWQYVGWRVEPHDGGESVYVYLVPDLEADVPLVGIYIGATGDPEQDTRYDHLVVSNGG